MKFTNMIHTIDIHGAGHPVRLITGGIPYLHGNTMLEKMDFMRDNYDWIRTTAVCEPRGYHGMVGAVITEPTNGKDHFGVFFMEASCYFPLSVACIMAIGRTLVQTGMVTAVAPETEVRLDTANRSIKVIVEVVEGEATKATLVNEASFLFDTDRKINVPGLGRVSFDIIYGSGWFAFVDVENIGLKITLSYKSELTETGIKINEALKNYNVQHPVHNDISSLNNWKTMFYEKEKDMDGAYRTQTVHGAGSGGFFDKSPCGASTCGMMAALYKKGKLDLHEKIINKNILGTKLTGRLIEQVNLGPLEAFIPEITGESYITGFNQLVLENDDYFKHGWSEAIKDLTL